MNKEKREGNFCYLSEGPVTYAQTLTSTSVRQAPASPERIYLAFKNAGRTAINAGIMNSAVRSAITPAANPNTATNAKILNLSFISVSPFGLEFKSKPLFSLTYTFLSIIPKPSTQSFNYKIKA